MYPGGQLWQQFCLFELERDLTRKYAKHPGAERLARPIPHCAPRGSFACAGKPTTQAMSAGPRPPLSASIAPSTRRGDALSIARWPRRPDPPSLASISSSVIAPPVIARRDVIVSGKGSSLPATTAGRREPNIGLLNLQSPFDALSLFLAKSRALPSGVCADSPAADTVHTERHVAIDAAAHLQLQLARAFTRNHEHARGSSSLKSTARSPPRPRLPSKRMSVSMVRFDQSPVNPRMHIPIVRIGEVAADDQLRDGCFVASPANVRRWRARVAFARPT